MIPVSLFGSGNPQSSLFSKIQEMVNFNKSEAGGDEAPCLSYLKEMIKSAVPSSEGYINLNPITDQIENIAEYSEELKEFHPDIPEADATKSYQQNVLGTLLNRVVDSRANFVSEMTGQYPEDVVGEKKSIIDGIYNRWEEMREEAKSVKIMLPTTQEGTICRNTFSWTLELVRWGFPQSEWKLKSEGTVTCDCDAGTNETFVKLGKYTLEADLIADFSSADIRDFSFTTLTNVELKTPQLVCCPNPDEEEEEEEESQVSLSDRDLPNRLNGGVPLVYPKNIIAPFIGLGLSLISSNIDLAFCYGASYLYGITGFGPFEMFLGALFVNEIIHAKNSFNEIFTYFGPQIALFYPLFSVLTLAAYMQGGFGYLVAKSLYSGSSNKSRYTTGFWALQLGLLFTISPTLMLGVTVPLLSVLRQKPRGDNSSLPATTQFGLNMNKTAALFALYITLGNRTTRRR